VRHGTMLRTDFFFLFFLEFTLRTIGQQVEAGGRKGEAIVKRTGGSLQFGPVWYSVQLHEQLHEQLHNFKSQTTNFLPNSLVSFSENSLL
jgi:hypothetical protein